MATETATTNPKIKKIRDAVWEIDKTFMEGMGVPIRVYANDSLINDMDERVFEQAANVATLPGIQKFSFVMPDGHTGYGSAIGGVSAFDAEKGVISPGFVGFDINCGMRLLITNLTEKEVKPRIRELVDTLFYKVPAGVGSSSKTGIDGKEFKKLAENGAEWAIKKGYGWKEDLERTELNGVADWADSSKISEKAISRGYKQMGTLGSGNHYLEIQTIRKGGIIDEKLAKKWGLFEGQTVIMFHCGSRGAGHQIASDYIQKFLNVMERKYKIKITDKELACAPFKSQEGQDYYSAMGCGINISFANRQIIAHRIREAFSEVFKRDPDKLGMTQLFDVAHNRASVEEHDVDGKKTKLVIHRKGSTGSYYPGRKEIPRIFRKDGSPVIIGGSMETGSYLLVGSDGAKETFCSTCHGSGRTMSRTAAKKLFDGKKLFEEMLTKGIYVKSVSWAGLAEESGDSYKSIDNVVDSVERAGLSRRVAKFEPLGNVKG